jgi:hypothetical protein
MHSVKKSFLKIIFFAECLGYGTQQRGFFKKNSLPNVALSKEI